MFVFIFLLIFGYIYYGIFRWVVGISLEICFFIFSRLSYRRMGNNGLCVFSIEIGIELERLS